MHRRTFLASAAAVASGAAAAAVAAPARADDMIAYAPGVAEAAMDAGEVILLDFKADWCSTCAAQARVIAALRAEQPAYAAIRFIAVDWDRYGDGELARALKVPRRSTLVALRGREELGRIVAGTGRAEIKALLDTALAAAA
jgi:thiol-disulfide isomerase/thioredoxin